MDVIVKKDGDIHLIQVSGPIDTSESEILKSELVKVLHEKPTKVIMDFSEVSSIGSSGIGKILVFFKELNHVNSSFEIKGIHTNIYKIFMALKFDQFFPISLK